MTHAQWQLGILFRSYIHMIISRFDGLQHIDENLFAFFSSSLLDSLGWVHKLLAILEALWKPENHSLTLFVDCRSLFTRRNNP
jgi:hypothetical protein